MTLALPFAPGQLVVVVLRDPRERVFGLLLGLEAAGVAVRGLDLQAWDETLSLVKGGEGEQVSVGTRFYPMHRVETIYLDEPTSGLPSLAETFLRRTGSQAGAFLAAP